MAYLVRVVNPSTGLAIAISHPFNTVTSPFSADVPLVQVGWGAESAFNMASAATPLPTADAALLAEAITQLQESTFTGRLGEVQASPTSNTVLARLKDLLSLIVLAAGDNAIGRVKLTDGTDVALVDGSGNLMVNLGVRLDATNDQVGQGAVTTGGVSSYSALSTAAVLSANIKGSAGQVYDLDLYNNGANEVFFRLYNQTGAPGTGDAANIIYRGMVPGSASGAGVARSFSVGRTCGTGIGIRVSAAVADNDATALTANEVLINVGYK